MKVARLTRVTAAPPAQSAALRRRRWPRGAQAATVATKVIARIVPTVCLDSAVNAMTTPAANAQALDRTPRSAIQAAMKARLVAIVV